MDPVLWEKYASADYTGTLLSINDKLKSVEAYEAMHVAGLCLMKLGDYVKGVDWLCAAISLSSAEVEYYLNSCYLARECKVYNYAMLFAETGLVKYPDNMLLNYAYALVLLEVNMTEKSIEYFLKTLAIAPDYVHAKHGYASALQHLGEWQKSLDVFDSIEVDSREVQQDILNSYTWSLLGLNRQQEALNLFNTKCDQTPRVLFNKGMIEIGLGMWPEGWGHYQSRKEAYGHLDTPFQHILQPMADSVEDLKGKRVVLFSEQGYGDTIQFVRYAALIAKHAQEIILVVPKPLIRLMEHSTIKFSSIRDEAPTAEEADVALSVMDCPWVFRSTVETIPDIVPYLFTYPNPHPIPWSGKLHVGLLWAGSSRFHDTRAYSIDKRRSIPAEKMSKLLDLSNMFQFVSLQYPDKGLTIFIDPRMQNAIKEDFDFYDTACIIDQLDLVITVDSAIAHLAGALGKQTWLLNRSDNCWRWFYDRRATTPWYPSMKLLYQENDWDEVIDRVYTDLMAFPAEQLVS